MPLFFHQSRIQYRENLKDMYFNVFFFFKTFLYKLLVLKIGLLVI